MMSRISTPIKPSFKPLNHQSRFNELISAVEEEEQKANEFPTSGRCTAPPKDFRSQFITFDNRIDPLRCVSAPIPPVQDLKVLNELAGMMSKTVAFDGPGARLSLAPPIISRTPYNIELFNTGSASNVRPSARSVSPNLQTNAISQPHPLPIQNPIALHAPTPIQAPTPTQQQTHILSTQPANQPPQLERPAQPLFSGGAFRRVPAATNNQVNAANKNVTTNVEKPPVVSGTAV